MILSFRYQKKIDCCKSAHVSKKCSENISMGWSGSNVKRKAILRMQSVYCIRGLNTRIYSKPVFSFCQKRYLKLWRPKREDFEQVPRWPRQQWRLDQRQRGLHGHHVRMQGTRRGTQSGRQSAEDWLLRPRRHQETQQCGQCRAVVVQQCSGCRREWPCRLICGI